MDTSTPAASPNVQDPLPGNPHVLWRQILGLVLWIGLPTAVFGPVTAALFLALGGVTFVDAWKAGIYKHPGKKNFLNISPMAWGIVMAMLLPVAYPAYLLNRNNLRTRQSTNAFLWAAVVLGEFVLITGLLSTTGRIATGAH
jgi:hypothetical protein